MKISVITVCYNAAGTIRNTLLSVFEQQNVELETIVIDGASKDDTCKIVSEFSSRIDKFVSEPDRGTYHAMNKGRALATGDLVAFLNADDVYADPDVLSDVARAARTSGASVVVGAVDQVDAQGRVVRRIATTNVSERDLRWGIFPPHPGTFVRSDIFDDVGDFDERFRVAADFDLFLRLHAHSRFSLTTIDRVVVRMLVGGASTSGFQAYRKVSRDMIGGLRKRDGSVMPARIYCRALRKLAQFRPALSGASEERR